MIAKEKLYNKNLASIKAFLENDLEVVKIIELCYLQPKDKSWRHWTDFTGNDLYFTDNDINILPSNTELIITDLYHQASILNISNYSKFCFIMFGGNIINLCFLGKDNRLRSLSSFDGIKWINNSPLSYGLNTLKIIVKNLNVTNYNFILNNKLKGPIEGDSLYCWETIWPPTKEFQEEMLKANEKLANQILNDCKIERINNVT